MRGAARALAGIALLGSVACVTRAAPPPDVDPGPDFLVETDRAFRRLEGGDWVIAIAVPAEEPSRVSTLRLNEAGIDLMRRVGCADHVLTPLPAGDTRSRRLAELLGEGRVGPPRLYAGVECVRREEVPPGD